MRPFDPGYDRPGERSGALVRGFAVRGPAVRWARELVVPERGTAVVVEVRPDGALVPSATYERAVSDAAFDAAEARTGVRVPDAWRPLLRQPSWLSRGATADGVPLEVFDPQSAGDHSEVWWKGAAGAEPELVVVGWCGGRPVVLEIDDPDPPVLVVDDVSTGLRGAVVLAEDSAGFRVALEAGTLTAVG